MPTPTMRTRSKLLGMDYGTAMNRLKKTIMLSLLQELKRDVCCRCGEQITEARDLSLEHVDAWMSHKQPQSAFWSLDNIKFSHLGCNCSAANRKRTLKYIGVTELKNRKMRYQARYWDTGKQKLIGYFATPQEAAQAYDETVQKKHGKRAKTNANAGLV